MPGPWKAWKSKSSFSPLSTAPWKSRPRREIPTFPQPGMPRMEKWETKIRFPTFPRGACDDECDLSVFRTRNQERRSAAPRPPQHRFSGSRSIGNGTRFQDHTSIGKCSGAVARYVRETLKRGAWRRRRRVVLGYRLYPRAWRQDAGHCGGNRQSHPFPEKRHGTHPKDF